MPGVSLYLFQLIHVFQSSFHIFLSACPLFQHKKVMAEFLLLDAESPSTMNTYFLDVSSFSHIGFRDPEVGLVLYSIFFFCNNLSRFNCLLDKCCGSFGRKRHLLDCFINWKSSNLCCHKIHLDRTTSESPFTVVNCLSWWLRNSLFFLNLSLCLPP